jgi:hypothetical protein
MFKIDFGHCIDIGQNLVPVHVVWPLHVFDILDGIIQ